MNLKCRSFKEVDELIAAGASGQLNQDELPTPALLVDLDALEHNVAKMTRHCKEHGLALRPHAKTHKCPAIAQMLIRAGAVGACTAKLSEACVLAHQGVDGLLVTTPVVGRLKIERAVDLARRHPGVLFTADHPRNIADLSDAATAVGVELGIVVDLRVGRKGGIAPGDAALDLVHSILSSPYLRFAGLQAYAGHASHAQGWEFRRAESLAALTPASEFKRRLEQSGIECPVLTGGSTGTWDIDCGVDGFTEMQPGSFLFMDIDYSLIGGRRGDRFDDFRSALSVLATVVSKPSADTAVVDAGWKAFASDRPFGPELRGVSGVAYAWGGDEHGKLDVSRASREIELGDRLEFDVPHCDPTVNLYDRMFAMRGCCVEAVWSIPARGMCQ